MFTWRTYGSWLPGQQGIVGWYVGEDGCPRIDHEYGRPASEAILALERYSRAVQTEDTVYLSASHAEGVFQGVAEAAAKRGHVVHALSVMADHLHLLFDAADQDRDMDRMLADWKALVSFRLNVQFGRRKWWAEKGSRRWYPPAAFGPLARYVRDQEGKLVGAVSPPAVAAILELEARMALEPGTQ